MLGCGLVALGMSSFALGMSVALWMGHPPGHHRTQPNSPWSLGLVRFQRFGVTSEDRLPRVSSGNSGHGEWGGEYGRVRAGCG